MSGWLDRMRRGGRSCSHLLLLGMLLLLLTQCSPEGDSVGLPPPSDTPSLKVERQAIDNLVQGYRQAMLQGDIDRVQALLAAEASTTSAQASPWLSRRQLQDGSFTSLAAFREHLSETFRIRTVTALHIPAEQIAMAGDLQSITFVEIESSEDPTRLLNQTYVYRTTFELTRTETATTVGFRIGAVTRQGPLVQITTPGQVQAGSLARVTVSDPAGLFGLSGGMARHSPTASEQILRSSGDQWIGTVTIPSETSMTTVQLDLQSTRGETLLVTHTLRVRQSGDRTVQPIVGTTDTRLQAVTVAGDGTVWAGGDNGATLYQVPAGTTTAELVGQLVTDPTGRIEDLVEDDQGRLQAVIFGRETSGVVVHDQGVFCQTVNVVDPSYPFRTADGLPSASTRAIAARVGAIWLHGSDDGIARAMDDVPPGQCPAEGITVTYDPIVRREDGLLPSNTVPALLAQADGTLWVGSALGLARLHNGQLTPVPFDPDLSFQGNPATLEAFSVKWRRPLLPPSPLTRWPLARCRSLRPSVAHSSKKTSSSVSPQTLRGVCGWGRLAAGCDG